VSVDRDSHRFLIDDGDGASRAGISELDAGWANGSRFEIGVDPQQSQRCILASRFDPVSTPRQPGCISVENRPELVIDPDGTLPRQTNSQLRLDDGLATLTTDPARGGGGRKDRKVGWQ